MVYAIFMKRTIGILFSIPLAFVLLFSSPSPVNAAWDGYGYPEKMRFQHQKMYDNLPFLGDKGYGHNGLLARASSYKIAIDIILSVLFITLFSRFIMTIFGSMVSYPFRNGAYGFVFLILFPLASLILLALLWLGIASFLFYGLVFLVGIFLTKIFIGWEILRNFDKKYVLDWKAGIVGPLVVFVLLLIPVLGWITLLVLFSMAVGALLEEITPLLKRQSFIRNNK